MIDEINKTQPTSARSLSRVFITLTLALIVCFGALLFLTRLSAERIPVFDESDTFISLSEVKDSVIPSVFSWLYSKQLEERSIRLDIALVNHLKESRLRLLRGIHDAPLSRSPLTLIHEDRELMTLQAQTLQVRQWLDSGQFMIEARKGAEVELLWSEQLLVALTQWVKPLEALSTADQLKAVGGESARSIILMAEAAHQKTSLPLEPRVRSILDQYHLAWYRHWAEEALRELSEPPSNILNEGPRERIIFERLKILKGLYQSLQKLSESLANFVYFKVLRANEMHWNDLWRLMTQEIKEASDEERRLKTLFHFGDRFAVLNQLRGALDEKSEDPSLLPKRVIEAWRKQFTSVSDITFAITLQQMGLKQSSPREDLEKVWFIPLLEERRVRGIEAELRGLVLRDLLKQYLGVNALTKSQRLRIRDQVKSLRELGGDDQSWTQRLHEVIGLLEPSWRSLRGSIDCREEELDIGDSWRDLGALDRLSPSLYLVSKTDRALLSRRVGRIYWSAERHQILKVRVYDEDKITDPDLLFIAPMPTVLQMILAQPVKAHGCEYKVELLNTESLATWLRD